MVKKKKSESYQHERQLEASKRHMTAHAEIQDRELAALVRLRDDEINTSDIPEVKDWSRAVVGKFYRPLKAPVTLRVDADVLDWLKSEGPGYQTRINNVLRAAMLYSKPNARSRDMSEDMGCGLRFPSLEKHGELEMYNRIAETIEIQHSVFAPA
jgi:uncharacterized protein (DUF4415 family)